MEKVITSLNATNWNGQFSFDGATGNFNTDGNKRMNSINGGKTGVGTFEASRMMGDEWEYRPRFSDITKVTELIALMTGAISAVEAELAE